MTVSVIIPTRNRDAVAATLVRTLLQQDHPSFDIWLVDQSDSNPSELEALATADTRVHVVRSFPPGTCRARNVGIAASKGEVAVFLDDDAVPTRPDFLSQHDAAYANPEIAGVAGRVIELRDAKAMRGPLLKIGRFGHVHPNASGTKSRSVDHARGGNMSFRRSVLERTGLFDDRFRGNAMREETDYSLRARTFGNILFVPEAEVEHRQHPSGGSRSFARVAWYEDFFFNEALFFGKHFPRWMRGILVLRKLRPIIACSVFYGHLRPRAVVAPWRGMIQGFREADRT